MTEKELVADIAQRIARLVLRLTKPLSVYNDDGRRQITDGPWLFEVRFYNPAFWSLSGPKQGDIESVTVRTPDNYSAVFWMSTNDRAGTENGYTLKEDVCRTRLLPWLKQEMILDDIIEATYGNDRADPVDRKR